MLAVLPRTVIFYTFRMVFLSLLTRLTDANFYCTIESKEISQCRIPADPVTLRYDVWTNKASCLLPKFDECTKVFIGYSQNCDTILCQDRNQASVIDLTNAFNLTVNCSYNEGVVIIKKKEGKKMSSSTAAVTTSKIKRMQPFQAPPKKSFFLPTVQKSQLLLTSEEKRKYRKTNLHADEHGVHGLFHYTFFV